MVAPTGDSGADLGRAAIAGVAFGDAGADETAAESGAGFTDSAGVGFCTAGAGVAAGVLTTGLGLGIGFAGAGGAAGTCGTGCCGAASRGVVATCTSVAVSTCGVFAGGEGAS